MGGAHMCMLQEGRAPEYDEAKVEILEGGLTVDAKHMVIRFTVTLYERHISTSHPYVAYSM